MLGIVKEISGQKTIIPLTTDTGTGAPVGTLIQQYKKKPMSGYLYCDGSTFDENAYPALYMYLGSNVLPDYTNSVENGYVYIKATSGLMENQQDNVLKDVKDYVDNSNSYSTEEVKTGGTWIDGKPIYRKVLINTTLINGGEIGWGGLESDITSLNIDNCVASYAVIEHNGMRYLQFMPDQGGFISYYSGIPGGAKVVMEYTKTTD